MKVLVLSGEESGNLYAREIADEFMRRDPKTEIRGYGDYGFKTSDLAVFGFFAVLCRLFFFLRVKRTMERAITEWRPDIIVTVDYPGLNLKLAAFAKARGIRAVHVVAPQVWAWKRGRIPRIERSLDALCCFFPFEPCLFKSGFATFVGHPLAAAFRNPAPLSARDGDCVALLPGSRTGEIMRNLPPLLEAAEILLKKHPALIFAIPSANECVNALIAEKVSQTSGETASHIRITVGDARERLKTSRCAAVASGTATLEAALAECPTVLVYRVSALLAWLARRLIRGTRYIGLANVIWEKCSSVGLPPMREILQEEFTGESVAAALEPFVSSDAECENARRGMAEVMKLLDGSGNPIAAIVDVALNVHS